MSQEPKKPETVGALHIRAAPAIYEVLRAHWPLTYEEVGVLGPDTTRDLLQAASRQTGKSISYLPLMQRNCGKFTVDMILAWIGIENHVCVCRHCGRSMKPR